MQSKALKPSHASSATQTPCIKAIIITTSSPFPINPSGDNDGSKRNSFTTSIRLCGHLVRCVASGHHRKLHPNHDPVLNGDDGDNVLLRESGEIVENGSVVKTEELAGKSLRVQINEVMLFSGPVTGLWMCAPLMSLISTAIIDQASSTELVALGPGTIFCDNMNLLFMFMSIATSNMVATLLAKGST